MFMPDNYEKNKNTTDRLNTVFVPKLNAAMSWDLTTGKILDYGCGPGSTGFNLILPMAEKTDSKLYSVDISQSMVEFARKHYPHPRIQYGQGHFPDSFPFNDLQFDKIFCIHVFHFIRDIRVTLDSIAKVLKPGGQMGFTTTTAKFPIVQTLDILGNSPKWAKYLGDCVQFIPEWSKYVNSSPEDFFENIFVAQTGMKKVFLTYLNQDFQCKIDAALEIAQEIYMGSLIVLLDICESMNPQLHKVPQELLTELRNDYKNLLMDLTHTKPGSNEITLPLEYVYGVVEKP